MFKKLKQKIVEELEGDQSSSFAQNTSDSPNQVSVCVHGSLI